MGKKNFYTGGFLGKLLLSMCIALWTGGWLVHGQTTSDQAACEGELHRGK